MRTFRNALFGGLAAASRFHLALPLYLISLLFGLLQTWPLILGLTSKHLSVISLQRMFTDGDAVAERISDPDILAAIGSWALIALLLTPIYGLFYNLLSGGILSVWSKRRGFWNGCWRFVLTFTAVGIMLVVLASLIGGLAGVGRQFAGEPVGLVLLVAGGIGLQLLNLIGEYSKAIAVVHDRRNPFVVFGHAVGFCVRHPGTLLFGSIGLGLHLAIAGLYVAVNRQLGIGPLAIALDQIVVLAWLWVKMLRLGWATSYVQQADQPHMNAQPLPLEPISVIQ